MGGRGAAGPGDIVLAGFRMFGLQWRQFVTIGALTIVPVTVVAVALLTPLTPDLVGDIMANQTAPTDFEARLEEVAVEDWIQWGVAYGIYAIVSSIVSTLALGASLVVAREQVQQRSIGVGDALRAMLPRLPRLLLLVFLVWVASAVGLVLCLLPGIWLLTSWSVAPVVVLHEDRSAWRSMGRSFRLVRTRFWPTFVVVLLTFAAMFFLQTGANAVASILLAPAGEGAGRLHFAAATLAAGVIAAVGVGVGASIITELYLDLVERAEGSAGAPTPPPLEAFS